MNRLTIDIENLIAHLDKNLIVMSLILFAIVTVVIVGIKIYISRRNKTIDSVIYLARNEINRISKIKPKKFHFDLDNDLLLPSTKALRNIFIINLIFAITFFILNESISWKIEDLSNLLTSLHAIIITIIIAIVILVAEGIRDSYKSLKGRVILVSSYILPLTLSEIFFLLSLLIIAPFNKSNELYQLFFLSMLLIASSASIYKALRLFINEVELNKRAQEIRLKLLNKSFERQLKQRVEKNLSNKQFGETKYSVVYYPSLLDKDNYNKFTVDDGNSISDIRPSYVMKLLEKLEDMANKQGFTFINTDNKRSIEVEIEKENEVDVKVLNERKLKPIKIYLHKLIDDSLSKNNVVISIDRSLKIQQEEFKEIENIIRNTFISSSKLTEEYQDNIELNYVIDNYIAAINEGKVSRIKEYNDYYFSIIDNFWSFLDKYGIKYSPEDAKSEISNFNRDINWIEIEKLSDDFRSIIPKGLQSNNKDVLEEVNSLLAGLLYKSVQVPDHLIFKYFLWLIEKAYEIAVTTHTDNSELKQYIIEHSVWVRLYESVNYFIKPHFQEEYDDKEVQLYEGFIIDIFKIYMNLLHRAVVHKDKKNFTLFLTKFFNLIETDPEYEHIEYTLRSAEGELNYNAGQPNVRSYQIKVEKLKKIKELISMKREIAYGITAWLFSNKKDSQSEFVSSLLDKLPMKVDELVEMYLKMQTRDVGDRCGWEWWNVKTSYEVTVMSNIGLNNEYALVFIIQLLRIFKNKSIDEIEKSEIPPARQIVFDTGDSGYITSILNTLKTKPIDAYLAKFIDEVQLELKIESIKKILAKSNEMQKLNENKYIVEYQVPEKIIKKFKLDFISEFQKDIISFRKLFIDWDLYEDLTNDPESIDIDSKRWGFNQLVSKEAFIENWHVHYGGFEENFARSFIKSENDLIFKEIEKASKQITKFEIDEKIDEFENIDNVIMLGGSSVIYRFGKYNKNIVWQNESKAKGQSGYYYKHKDKLIPVIQLYNKLDTLFVLDKNKIGKFQQLYPLEKNDSKDSRYGLFYLSIKFFSNDEKLLNDFLTNPPKWLKDKSDKTDYLKQQAQIKIFERFAFTLSDDFKGFKIKFRMDVA